MTTTTFQAGNRVLVTVDNTANPSLQSQIDALAARIAALDGGGTPTPTPSVWAGSMTTFAGDDTLYSGAN